MKYRAFVLPAVLLLLAIFPLEADTGTTTVYTVAVPTQLAPLEMHKNWTPFLERLSKEMGVTFSLKVYRTIPEYDDDVLKGVPDFAFLNPYLVVMTKNTEGYIPLLRDRNPLTGILVVRKDGPIVSLRQLNGKELAFPTPNAFGASLYMRALLTRKEKITFTPRYVMSHSNVYRSVILGKNAAGGGVNKSLGKEPEEVRSQLRILYQTPQTAPHPLSAHPRIPAKVRAALIETVLRLAKDKGARDILKKIQMPDPVRSDYAADYQPLEELGLEKFVVRGEK